MKVRDVLTAEPMTLEQIVDLVNDECPPWLSVYPTSDVMYDLEDIVASGVAVRVTLPVGHGWRLAGAT